MAIFLKNIFKPKSQKEILDRLNNLKSDSVGLWGVMTVSQMLHHLSMANQIALGEIVLPDKSRFLSRTVFRWMSYFNMRPSVTRLKKKALRTFKEVDIVRNKISVQDFDTEKQFSFLAGAAFGAAGASFFTGAAACAGSGAAPPAF